MKLPKGAVFEWNSFSTNKDVISILADGAMATILPLLEIIYDFKAWFRQLVIYKTDYCKHNCHVMGVSAVCEIEDCKGASPNSSQRLIILLVKLITIIAVEVGWVIEQTSSDGDMQDLVDWFQAPEDNFGKDYPQSLPLYFSLYQDDILAVSI